MAGSPFANRGGAAAQSTGSGTTATAPRTNASSDLPGPVARGGGGAIVDDPYGDVSNPAGIAGIKTSFLLGQMVLMKPNEAGEHMTVNSKPGEPSQYVDFDITMLTVPQPGAANAQTTTVDDEGMFQILNKDGDTEKCEPYVVGERLQSVLVYNKPLVREGVKKIGQGGGWLKGWIVKGTKKQGQSAPYILRALEEDDIALYNERLAVAREWWAANGNK